MRFAWVLLLTMSGCALERADWHGDKRFTAEERSAIESGAEWLAGHAGTTLTIEWDYEVSSGAPLPRTIRRERGPRSTGACAGATVYMGLDDARAEDVAGLAAHELAHCTLGLVDDDETQGIMRVVTPMRWTEREAAQLRHVTTAASP